MAKFRIGQIVEVVVNLDNPNFDKACEQAFAQASIMFGLNDDVYLSNVEVNNAENPSPALHSIVIDFKHCRYKGGGEEGRKCFYVFDTWVHRNH